MILRKNAPTATAPSRGSGEKSSSDAGADFRLPVDLSGLTSAVYAGRGGGGGRGRTTGLGLAGRRCPLPDHVNAGAALGGLALRAGGGGGGLGAGFGFGLLIGFLKAGFLAAGALGANIAEKGDEAVFPAAFLATGFGAAFLTAFFGAAFFAAAFFGAGATFFAGFLATFFASGFLAVGAFEPNRPENGDDAFAAGFPAGFPTAFCTAFFGLLLPPPLNIAGHTAGCCCTAMARSGAVAATCYLLTTYCQADAVATRQRT